MEPAGSSGPDGLGTAADTGETAAPKAESPPDLAVWRAKMFELGWSAWGRNRTSDTGIFSPLLYRLSYPGKRCAEGLGTRRGVAFYD